MYNSACKVICFTGTIIYGKRTIIMPSQNDRLILQNGAIPTLRDTIPFLLDIYGALLTDRQRDVLDLYYNDDLSLSEISENLGITRQGVRDAIKKGGDALLDLERRLSLFKRSEAVKEQAEKILLLTDNAEIADYARRIIEAIDS